MGSLVGLEGPDGAQGVDSVLGHVDGCEVAGPAEDEAWAGRDPRLRAWQAFYPATAQYQALGRSRPGPGGGPDRVLVAWGRPTAVLPDLDGWDGLVVARGPQPAVRDLEVAGFHWVRRFVVLPNLEDARWYVPAGEPRLGAAALAMYTPYRATARARKLGLEVLARLGVAPRLGDGLLLARRQAPALEEVAGEVFPARRLHLALSAGRRERAFKLSAAIMDEAGRLLGVARICRPGDHRQVLIEQEADLLRALRARYPHDGLAPELLFAGRRGDLFLAVHEALAGQPGPTALTPAHRRLLEALVTGPPRPASRAGLVRELHLRAERWYGSHARFQRLLGDLDRALAGLQLPRAVVHGDFAPWNLRLDGEVLRAFDWEYGSLDGLPHLDALHHELQVGRLLRRWSAERIVAEARAFVARDPTGQGAAAARTLLWLYLADRCLRMAEETGDPHHPDARSYLELWERLAPDAGPAGRS